MCNVTPRTVTTAHVTESVRTCSNHDLNAIRQELEALKAENANLRSDLNQLRDDFEAHRADPCAHQAVAPGVGCIGAPSVEQCGAPAGKGLTTNPEGWPANSVRTAGGYTVVPEGKDAAWSIYGPDQKPGDKPMTRIWGDPHVDEGDGTRWDFTKNSNFRLPDGTMINCQTTSETGQSVSKGLTIVNGADRVNITGIDKNKPALSAVTRDGYEWRNEHISSNPNRDTFVLGGNGKDQVQWFRERGGEVEGLITGARSNVDGKGSYDQIIDKSQKYFVCPNLQPPVGSAAWGNQLRSAIVDSASHHLPPEWSKAITADVSLDDAKTRFASALQDALRSVFGDNALGGLFRLFGGGGDLFGRAQSAVGGLGNNMLEQWSLLSLFGQNRSSMMYA